MCLTKILTNEHERGRDRCGRDGLRDCHVDIQTERRNRGTTVKYSIPSPEQDLCISRLSILGHLLMSYDQLPTID